MSVVQTDASFQACAHLTKLLWNKAFEAAWPLLRDTAWEESLRPLAQALEARLRHRVAEYISKAYSSIAISSAAALMGLTEQQAIQCARALTGLCQKLRLKTLNAKLQTAGGFGLVCVRLAHRGCSIPSRALLCWRHAASFGAEYCMSKRTPRFPRA
jgi:hypothetical protein